VTETPGVVAEADGVVAGVAVAACVAVGPGVGVAPGVAVTPGVWVGPAAFEHADRRRRAAHPAATVRGSIRLLLYGDGELRGRVAGPTTESPDGRSAAS
jgi:hypothetical protein